MKVFGKQRIFRMFELKESVNNNTKDLPQYSINQHFKGCNIYQFSAIVPHKYFCNVICVLPGDFLPISIH